jgi:hypothetical protein
VRDDRNSRLVNASLVAGHAARVTLTSAPRLRGPAVSGTWVAEVEHLINGWPTMPDLSFTTVVATFADLANAQIGVDALTRDGISSTAIHLHEKGATPRNAAGVVLDEYASGGFFTNFAHLLDDLLGTPHQSPSYEEVVQFEGVVVSVQGLARAQVGQVEARLRNAGAQNVSSGRESGG